MNSREVWLILVNGEPDEDMMADEKHEHGSRFSARCALDVGIYRFAPTDRVTISHRTITETFVEHDEEVVT